MGYNLDGARVYIMVSKISQNKKKYQVILFVIYRTKDNGMKGGVFRLSWSLYYKLIGKKRT